MIAFPFNGLLRVSESDPYTDDVFSDPGEIGGFRKASALGKYAAVIKACSGKTPSEKIRNDFLGIGVISAEPDEVARILG